MNFIDIHTHLCPGIDDGPDDTDTTIDMLEMGYLGGTREVVFTPHMFLDPYNNTVPEKVVARFGQVVACLEEAAEEPELEFLGEMKFYLGSENYVCTDFVNALQNDDVLTINEGPCLLIEFTPFFPWSQYLTVVNMIKSTGRIPVIAHCERYPPIKDDIDKAKQLVELGCLLQVNAQSLLGNSKDATTQTAFQLLEERLVYCLASDAHSLNRRPLQLTPTLILLRKQFSEELLHDWLITNPSRIVHGF